QLLAERQQARKGHFMPTSLMQSQLDTLQPLGADEAGLRLDVAEGVDLLVADAVQALRARGR
ncbi:MAG: gluconokinase, partial [Marmoricola sp.]